MRQGWGLCGVLPTGLQFLLILVSLGFSCLPVWGLWLLGVGWSV